MTEKTENTEVYESDDYYDEYDNSEDFGLDFDSGFDSGLSFNGLFDGLDNNNLMKNLKDRFGY